MEQRHQRCVLFLFYGQGLRAQETQKGLTPDRRKSFLSKVRERGLEPTQETPGNTAIEPGGGAKSGALFQPGGCGDADLARVVSAWPGLPEDVRQSILAAVQEASADMVD